MIVVVFGDRNIGDCVALQTYFSSQFKEYVVAFELETRGEKLWAMITYEPCPSVHSFMTSSVGEQLMMKVYGAFVGSLFAAMALMADLNVSSSSSLK